jgi:hypothetical protein
MAIYTFHVKGDPDPSSIVDRTVSTREGFSWAALFLGPLWLVWHRLWLALLIWVAAQVAIWAFVVWLFPGFPLTGLLQVLLAIAIGTEGSHMRSAGLSRRGYVPVDVLSAPSAEQAERIFFERGLTDAREQRSPLLSMTSRVPNNTAMVGLFPSMGG